MPKHVVIKQKDFVWVDVLNHSPEELSAIAAEYNLHPNAVKDCLDPEHQPKFEKMGELSFLILRAFDELSSPDGDSIQELTRKTAIFFNSNFVLTIHRKDQVFLEKLRAKWTHQQPAQFQSSVLLLDLLFEVIHSYEKPVDESLTLLEQLEMAVFEAQGARPFAMAEGYYLKRKASIFKWMLRAAIDVLPKLAVPPEAASQAQNIREEADGLLYYAEDLRESINSLLNLHISLSTQKTTEASHRINEIVRVLTVFSVFLLPLNLLTGIFGMNFEHMPELKWQYGYPAVLLSMLAVTGLIYIWFKKKGWLKG